MRTRGKLRQRALYRSPQSAQLVFKADFSDANEERVESHDRLRRADLRNRMGKDGF